MGAGRPQLPSKYPLGSEGLTLSLPNRGPSSSHPTPHPRHLLGPPAQAQLGETQGPHLHAVVLVVHVLEPGNELAGVEPVAHGLVLIPLKKRADVDTGWRRAGQTAHAQSESRSLTPESP